MDGMMERAQSALDLKSIVEKKIEAFDVSALESIVYSIASREFKMIEILGGVLGFLIGLGQVALLILTARQ